MSSKDPSLLKQQRIGYLFCLVWGSFVLAWSVFVGIDGQFRYGKQGPIITPESNPEFFWTVVIGSSLLGLAVVIASLIPFLRSFQNGTPTD